MIRSWQLVYVWPQCICYFFVLGTFKSKIKKKNLFCSAGDWAQGLCMLDKCCSTVIVKFPSVFTCTIIGIPISSLFPFLGTKNLIFFSGAGDWTQGLTCVKQVLYSWAILQAPRIFQLPSTPSFPLSEWVTWGRIHCCGTGCYPGNLYPMVPIKQTLATGVDSEVLWYFMPLLSMCPENVALPLSPSKVEASYPTYCIRTALWLALSNRMQWKRCCGTSGGVLSLCFCSPEILLPCGHAWASPFEEERPHGEKGIAVLSCQLPQPRSQTYEWRHPGPARTSHPPSACINCLQSHWSPQKR
jgi:hypothetical protein